MEYNNVEIKIVSEVAAQISETEVQELNDLQLMLVGGGGVDVALQ